jgi:carboxypeptidase Taq
MESKEFIYKEQKELSVLGGIGALLGWDQLTYMPPLGATERSEQAALLSKLAHDRVISDTFWNHINNLMKPSKFKELNQKDKLVVKKLFEDVEKSRKIPSDFVVRMAKASTLSYQAWDKAQKKSDFKIFSPHLKKIVELEKEYCGYIDPNKDRYDILIDDYEERMTTEKLKHEFLTLKKEIKKLLSSIIESKIYQKQKPINIKFNKSDQKKLCNLVIEKMNLSKNNSRIDESTHPFTTSLGYDDTRITTNYDRGNPLFSFFSTVHEAGHALYELGMPQDEFKYTVISDSPSLGMHESQSRFWENMVARNKSFWKYFLPEFKKINSDYFKSINLDKWYQLTNQVKPSLIRVEADELTYCLHVILRFEIEIDLISDKINVKDLPNIWNEKINDFLSICPTNDKEGVLQDMHWSGGSIGYFPTYAIGSIYSAQIFNQLIREKPETISEIENGNLNNILTWLRTNIHSHGRSMTADEIIKKTCGTELNANIFIKYLKDKYSEIYEI